MYRSLVRMENTPNTTSSRSQKNPRTEEPSEQDDSPMDTSQGETEVTPTRPKKIKQGSGEAEAWSFLQMTGSKLCLTTHRQAQMTFSKSVILNSLFASMCILAVQFIMMSAKAFKSISGINLSDVSDMLQFVKEELLEGVEPTQIWQAGFMSSGV
jgi:cobalamin biosynthesis Mg chelatase CobN